MHYHLVFTVKYRRALLTPEVVSELTRISLAIQERHEFEMLGTDKNHVHLLCAAHPNKTLPQAGSGRDRDPKLAAGEIVTPSWQRARS